MKVELNIHAKIFEPRTGFKSFNLDRTNCYGKIFEEGKEYHCDGEIKFGPHGNGFHFAERLEDTIRYSGNPCNGATRNVEMNISLNSDAKVKVENGSVLVFKIGPESYAGTISMEDSIVATQTGKVNVKFDDKAPVYEGLSVTVKYNGLTIIGKGKITKVK